MLRTHLEVVQQLQKEQVSVWAVEQTEQAVLAGCHFIPKKETSKHAFVLGERSSVEYAQEVVDACGQST